MWANLVESEARDGYGFILSHQRVWRCPRTMNRLSCGVGVSWEAE
jgi:hypothetical protein